MTEAKKAAVANRPEKTVPLEFPVEFDGKTYESITVRMLTVGEWREFLDGGREFGSWLDVTPMFDAPREVLDALMTSDGERVTEAADLFRPGRSKGEVPA